MDKLLEGKIALITGAGAGIGKATAKLFASEGAVVYALDIKGMQWVAEEGYESNRIIPVELDICDFAAVKEVVMTAKKAYGHIDILANIAGLISYEMIPMIDYEKFRKMLDVNVVALIHLMSLVSRVMTRQQSGSIINMASMVGEKGSKGQLSLLPRNWQILRFEPMRLLLVWWAPKDSKPFWKRSLPRKLTTSHLADLLSRKKEQTFACSLHLTSPSTLRGKSLVLMALPLSN